ncbi:ras-related protein Rab-5B-like [Bolinopsis microptera]|uniref:ras-related protein Rab-5B-like n=1 Tax=Bolinopsis microptera TaxID=2820187 RepID=UPI00307AF7FE
MTLRPPDKKEFKVCLFGDSSVGKTSIVRRFVQNTFSEFQAASIGAAYTEKSIKIEDETYKIQIWDLAGQETFKNLAPMYYRGAAAAILAFDITYKNSFISVDSWMSELNKNAPEGIVLVLVGNKADSANIRQVSVEDIQSYTTKHNIIYFEASAKSGENVEEIFHFVCKSVPDKRRKNLMTLSGGSKPLNRINLNDLCETEIRNKKRCC